jgi:hypothetical protein
MSELPTWAKWLIIATGVLLSPFVFMFVAGFLCGFLKAGGVFAFVGLVGAAGTGFVLFKKLRVRPQSSRS